MKRIFTLPVSSLLLVFLFIYCGSCRKTDSIIDKNTLADKEITQQFFNLSPTEHPLVKRIAAEIKRRNDANPFIADFARLNGFAVWDKAILAPKPKSILQRDGDGFEQADTLVYVPLVLPDSLQINGSILAKVKGDSVFVKYVLAQDYKAYSFAGGRNVVTADQFATFMLVLNREVFGHETFTITDERLFDDPSYPDADTTTKEVSFDTAHVDNLNIPSIGCEYIQIRICGSNGGSRTSTRTGGGSNCYTLTQEQCYVIFDDTGGWGGGSSGSSGGSPSGSGSGSSGGGSIPHDYPCSSTGTCNPPGGGIGWFPTMPIEDDFPGDEIWQNTNLKDSSQNPCIDTALQKLKLISAKIPAMIREYYGKNPAFMVTYKVGFAAPTITGAAIKYPEIAWTPVDTTSSFITYFNSYYSGMTNLSYAITVLHEALHCQIMNEVRLARYDSLKLVGLAEQYGYVFDVFKQDSVLDQIASLNTVQHNLMTTKYIDILGAAIYEYAQSMSMNITLSQCKDLAWLGMSDAEAWKNLPQAERTRLEDIISAEQDPAGTFVNTGNNPPIGNPCN